MKNDIEPIYRNVGVIIRHLRLRKGIDQSKLGEHMGWNRTSVTNIENGHQRFMMHDLVRLSKFLGTTPEHLTKGMWE